MAENLNQVRSGLRAIRNSLREGEYSPKEITRKGRAQERDRLERAGRGRGPQPARPDPLSAAADRYLKISPNKPKSQKGPAISPKKLIRARASGPARYEKVAQYQKAASKDDPVRAARGRYLDRALSSGEWVPAGGAAKERQGELKVTKSRWQNTKKQLADLSQAARRQVSKLASPSLTSFLQRSDADIPHDEIKIHLKALTKVLHRAKTPLKGGKKVKAVKGKEVGSRRKDVKIDKRLKKQRPGRGGHGAGGPGKSGARQAGYGDAYGPSYLGHREELQQDDSMSYLPKTLVASGLFEEVLLERRSKKAKQARAAAQAGKREAYLGSADRTSAERKQKRAGLNVRKANVAKKAAAATERGETGLAADLGKSSKRGSVFKAMRGHGKIKGHKKAAATRVKKSGEKQKGSKYENPTTFKKCSPGAMISTPHLRQELPLNQFSNPDDKYPTWPLRPGCRASLAGLGRALQFANPNRQLKKAVIQKVNALGGVRGKARIKLWGTGVGGSRMETHRGPSGAPKRNKRYGTPTGERDNRLHTDSDEHGQRGNREVPRAHGHAAKQPIGPKTKRKTHREKSARAAHISRGQKRIGSEKKGGKIESARRIVGASTGRTLAAKFAAKKKKNG